MPAVYQGTRLQTGPEPIANLRTPAGVGADRQRAKLDFLEQLNRRHAAARPDQTELDARIGSYELAFRMQAEAPEAVDLAGESQATRELYGMDDKTDRGLRPQLPARPPAGRARRALRPALPRRRQQVGRPLGPREEPRRAVRPDGQARRRAAERPQEPRAARRDAGRLGRRVRPHADEREGRRPRPQPLRLHHVDGRRRRRRAAGPSAPPTTSACTPSRTASTSTTCTPRSCT